ncbi:MAG: hypothetical protein Q9219_005229 [cf. Caloplaca sp. 3 TL-2023]
MANLGLWLRSIFARSHSPPREFSTTGAEIDNRTQKLEEENWEWYRPGLFYPVRIGEIFQSRYQVLGKLGYGSRSTAWLCRDLNGHRYVTLKVCELESSAIRREVAAYSHLNTIRTSNPGSLYVRTLLDSFKATGPAGEYQCLVHEPLGMSMETLRELAPGRKLPQDLLRSFLVHLLNALDFLHTDAQMIHAGILILHEPLVSEPGDLQASNVHLRIEDDSILKYFETAELRDPSPRKVDGDRVIYESRGLRLPKKHGRPVLCDLGEARFGKENYTDDIQPYVYRAPEIILDIPWTYSVDIWNVGVMIWDIFENKHLFNARDSSGEASSLHHMAEMVAIMGTPPLDYLRRTESSWEYFDINGNWKGAVGIPNHSLEDSEEQLSGDNKALFLDFMRKMLLWVPEDRQTAKQLLKHPWLSK